MFYLLDTDLTRASKGNQLLDVIHDRLMVTGATWVTVDNESALESRLGDEDAVVFCCPVEKTPMPPEFERFVHAARGANSTVLPIAVDADSRLPPAPADHFQSWDLSEFQAVRNHVPDYVAPAADEFVRKAVALVDPTCCTAHPTLFIAHRRQDGESVARELGNELRRRGHDTFRDLGDLDVGDHGQAAIDRHLADSDGLIFLDSQAAGESRAVTAELRTAIGNRIPIVWVRLDPNEKNRARLDVVPTGAPHVTYDESMDGIAELADAVIAQFQELASLVVSDARSTLNDLQSMVARADLHIERREGINATFHIEITRRTLAYPEKPLRHLCQFFGRRVTDEDVAALRSRVSEEQLDPSNPYYEAVVLLDPRPRSMVIDDHMVLVNGQDYIESLGGGRSMARRPPQLLLSGSWSEPRATDSEALRAVGDIAEEWLKLGGAIVFGGHPTFTPAIIGAARRVHPIAPERYVTMFQSGFFTDIDVNEADALHCTVIATRDEGTRERSLRLMRTRMLEQPGIVAMITIGGRTDTDGIDEEVELAGRQGVRVVPLAAAGGRSAELTNEIDERSGWSAFTIPPISGADLKKFSVRTDYRGIARDLFEVLAEAR